MAYLITYDLYNSGQKYNLLERAIEELGPARRITSTTWILIHPGPCKYIRDYLLDEIDENDRIIVMECAGAIAWYGLNRTLETWLHLNL